MSKVIGTILIIAIVVAVTVMTGNPAFMASLAAFLGTSAAIATAVLLVTAMALEMLVAAIFLKPSAPKINQSMQDRLNTQVNPIAPRKIVFGLTAAGADVRFEEQIPQNSDTSSSTPPTLYQVIALASHKLTSVQSVYFENELSYSGGAVTGKYASGLTIAPTLEGSTANASAFGSGSYWTSTAKFTGCAYMKLTYKLDTKIFPNGLPTRITTIVQGCPVYDPRLDSTNGGSGTMRPNDQTTWAYTNAGNDIGRNPACCLLTYLLGYKINGKLAWGMGIPVEFIDFANFIAYANICDESVTALGGGTVKRYLCDLILDTSLTHEQNIMSITNAMGTAVLVDTAGLYQLVGGHDDTTGPILSYTADDILGPYTWKPATSSRDRFNIATGRYADPNNLYVLGSWGQIELNPLNDGIPRTQQMDFAAVSRPEQCQRIAKQKLVRNQYCGTFTANMGPKAFEAQVGSLLYLSLPAESWNNKLFRVIDQQESAELLFQMTLQEESSAIYTWDYNETLVLPPNVDIAHYDATQSQTPQNLTASTRQVTNSTGGIDSYIDVHWTVPSTAVRSIQIQAKPSTDTIWQNITSNSDPFTGAYTFRAPVSGVSTDVQARYEMTSGMFGAWVTATITAASGAPQGIQSTVVELYQRAASAPAVPSVTTTYTWATNTLSGQNNGWLTSIPATNGNPLYVTAATASSPVGATTDTIASTEWATPVIMAQDGAAGATGSAAAMLRLGTSQQQVTYNGSGVLTPSSQTVTFFIYHANLSSTTYTISAQRVDGTIINANSYIAASTGTLTPSGNNATYNGTTGFTMTGSAFDTARGTTNGIQFTVSHADGVQDECTITKAADGASAKTLYLSSNRQVISYDSTGALNPTSQDTNFILHPQNLSSTTYTIAMTDTNGTTLNANSYITSVGGTATPSGNNISLSDSSVTPLVKMTAANFNTARGSSSGVIVTASHADGVSDQLNVVRTADGSTGAAAPNVATVYLYKRAASSPTPAVPSVTCTYTFSTSTLTGQNNGWTQTIPSSNGQPCWITTATALSSGTTDTIATTEWATPTIYAQDGAAGPTVSLTATAGAFYFVDGTPTSTAQTITFTASSTNASDTFTFSTSPTVTLTGTGASRTMSLAAFGSNQQCVVTATGSVSGVSVTYTVYRIDDSSNSDSIIPDPNMDGTTNAGNVSGKPWTASLGDHGQLP